MYDLHVVNYADRLNSLENKGSQQSLTYSALKQLFMSKLSSSIHSWTLSLMESLERFNSLDLNSIQQSVQQTKDIIANKAINDVALDYMINVPSEIKQQVASSFGYVVVHSGKLDMSLHTRSSKPPDSYDDDLLSEQAKEKAATHHPRWDVGLGAFEFDTRDYRITTKVDVTCMVATEHCSLHEPVVAFYGEVFNYNHSRLDVKFNSWNFVEKFLGQEHFMEAVKDTASLNEVIRRIYYSV